MLETVEVEWGGEPRAAIVWLHGLGADGHDFEPVVDELRLPIATRFVFPHAPVRPVTLNGGMRMRAWYDLLSLDRGGREDADGIAASAVDIAALVEREIGRGIDSRQIVIGGFSQGGALSLYTALRICAPLAGVVALSAYLPLASALTAQRSRESVTLPIWMAHGSDDDTVPLALAESSRAHLHALGHHVTLSIYRMGHGVCPQELGALRERLCEWVA